MLQIYKLRDHQVIDFAAEELKKYLRMMMPEEKIVDITLDPLVHLSSVFQVSGSFPKSQLFA